MWVWRGVCGVVVCVCVCVCVVWCGVCGGGGGGACACLFRARLFCVVGGLVLSDVWVSGACVRVSVCIVLNYVSGPREGKV